MSINRKHATPTAGAIAPAVVAIADRTNGPAAEPASVTGSIPSIISNDDGLFEGDLVGYFHTLFFGATNLDRPYHNLRHMLHVTWLCYQAAEFYRDRLTPRQIRNLLIAALFHDFDHPGHPHPGTNDPDGINIDLAIAGLRRHVAADDRPFLPAIEALIEATHYPYTINSADLDLSGHIIRDADLAQALSPVWIQQIVIGLAREWQINPIEALQRQPGFLSALSFNTEWARKRFPSNLVAEKITEAERLLALLARDNPNDRAAKPAPGRRVTAVRNPRAKP